MLMMRPDPLFDHVSAGFLASGDHGDQVDVEDVQPILGIAFEEGLAESPAGVVDEDVQLTVALDCTGYYATGGVGVAEVGLHGFDLGSAGAQFIAEGLGPGDAVGGGHHQAAAFRRQSPHDARADASATAGDDRYAALQACHGSLVSQCRWCLPRILALSGRDGIGLRRRVTSFG